MRKLNRFMLFLFSVAFAMACDSSAPAEIPFDKGDDPDELYNYFITEGKATPAVARLMAEVLTMEDPESMIVRIIFKGDPIDPDLDILRRVDLPDGEREIIIFHKEA